jgi:hypothetical protein
MTNMPIRTGDDLRKYILRLLRQKESEAGELKKAHPPQRARGRKASAFPPLLDYLLSLWAAAEKYRDVDEVSWSLIAQILEEAFNTSPKRVDWTELLKTPCSPAYGSKANTPEYYEEIKNYPYFEKSIRNTVVSLKSVFTHGAENLGDSKWGYCMGSPRNHRYYWESHSTRTFLERGTAFLEGEMEDGSNPEYPVSWFDLESVLSSGHFGE